MKKTLVLTLLLENILWANKLSCTFPQEKLEAKGLELFTVRYMDRAVVLATYR